MELVLAKSGVNKKVDLTSNLTAKDEK